MVNRFDVVWIPHRKFGEGDLRLQHRPLAMVMPHVCIVSRLQLILRHCRRELVAHGNILSIMVPMLLERRHPANAVVISLQVPALKIMTWVPL